MTFTEWLDSLKDKTVAIVGIGVSNTPLIRLLTDRDEREIPKRAAAHRTGGAGREAANGRALSGRP